MESSGVLLQVMEEKRAARRRLFKTISQSVVITIFVQVVALFLSALVVVLFHVGSLRMMAVITTVITMFVTFFGLWVLAIWLDLK
jgi:Kef-type K+ transport system membrane component KefB